MTCLEPSNLKALEEQFQPPDMKYGELPSGRPEPLKDDSVFPFSWDIVHDQHLTISYGYNLACSWGVTPLMGSGQPGKTLTSGFEK